MSQAKTTVLPYQHKKCGDYQVYAGSLSALSLSSQKPLVVNTINAWSYLIAEKDQAFMHALKSSDVLLPDGIGVVWAAKYLSGNSVTKLAGADLFFYIMERLEKENKSCFFLGASPATLDQIKTRAAQEYPHVKTGFHSPPFKKEFTTADSEQMIQAVNSFRPDVLFIGMTAPKQEKWVHQHKDLLDARLIGSIGAVFDFYAGTTSRPHSLFINMGLEWLGRLLAEPKRLWRRYLIGNTRFVSLILKQKKQPNR